MISEKAVEAARTRLERDLLRPIPFETAKLAVEAALSLHEDIAAVLEPFALLCGPYDHDDASDDAIVRCAGTLGKDGDRGYQEVTVADLRRAKVTWQALIAEKDGGK